MQTTNQIKKFVVDTPVPFDTMTKNEGVYTVLNGADSQRRFVTFSTGSCLFVTLFVNKDLIEPAIRNTWVGCQFIKTNEKVSISIKEKE